MLVVDVWTNLCFTKIFAKFQTADNTSSIISPKNSPKKKQSKSKYPNKNITKQNQICNSHQIQSLRYYWQYLLLLLLLLRNLPICVVVEVILKKKKHFLIHHHLDCQASWMMRQILHFLILTAPWWMGFLIVVQVWIIEFLSVMIITMMVGVVLTIK